MRKAGQTRRGTVDTEGDGLRALLSTAARPQSNTATQPRTPAPTHSPTFLSCILASWSPPTASHGVCCTAVVTPRSIAGTPMASKVRSSTAAVMARDPTDSAASRTSAAISAPTYPTARLAISR